MWTLSGTESNKYKERVWLHVLMLVKSQKVKQLKTYLYNLKHDQQTQVIFNVVTAFWLN